MEAREHYKVVHNAACRPQLLVAGGNESLDAGRISLKVVVKDIGAMGESRIA